MGYQCSKYGPCGYFSSFAGGDTRKRLEEEETGEKTKHHNHKIYAWLHPGIDNDSYPKMSNYGGFELKTSCLQEMD